MKIDRKIWLAAGVMIAGLAYLLVAIGKDDKGADMTKNIKSAMTDQDWKKKLTPEQYRILRQKGTERAFTGKYWNTKEEGVYYCAGCGEKLFVSDTKFDSGCGWPSFYAPAATNVIAENEDKSIGMQRTEVVCSKCGGHLGHVFNDGPKPTGLRYCINSESLNFSKKAVAGTNSVTEIITLGAGCFWCTEAAYRMIDGVTDVKVGYMGGKTKNPTYRDVCKGDTGHAEVAQITFDPVKTGLSKILEVFFKVHDPTQLNRQGADVGTQYRSAIFYHSEKQKAEAEKSIAEHQKEYKDKIVTEITPAVDFYEAEDYHQEYYKNNSDQPYCRAVIKPKLEKLKDKDGLKTAE